MTAKKLVPSDRWPWTHEEDERLVAGYNSGDPIGLIIVGLAPHTRDSVNIRITRLRRFGTDLISRQERQRIQLARWRALQIDEDLQPQPWPAVGTSLFADSARASRPDFGSVRGGVDSARSLTGSSALMAYRG
jgi:hypothetical protein